MLKVFLRNDKISNNMHIKVVLVKKVIFVQ